MYYKRWNPVKEPYYESRLDTVFLVLVFFFLFLMCQITQFQYFTCVKHWTVSRNRRNSYRNYRILTTSKSALLQLISDLCCLRWAFCSCFDESAELKGPHPQNWTLRSARFIKNEASLPSKMSESNFLAMRETFRCGTDVLTLGKVMIVPV